METFEIRASAALFTDDELQENIVPLVCEIRGGRLWMEDDDDFKAPGHKRLRRGHQEMVILWDLNGIQWVLNGDFMVFKWGHPQKWMV